MTQEKNRIIYYDKLRILSALFIPMIHVSAQYWDEAAVTSLQWQFMSLYDIIGMSGVPIFFMLSGALMLNADREMSYSLLFKKILRFIFLYLFWLLLYNFFPFIIRDKAMYNFNLKDIFYNLLLGHGIYHLWFIPELTVMYLITPILRELFKSKKVCKYYLGIYFLTGIVIPSLLLFENLPYRIFIDSLYKRTSLPMLTGYIGYYVLGMYLSNYLEIKNKKHANILLTFFIILSNLTAFVINAVDAVKKESPSTLFTTPLALPIFMSSVSIFILFKINEKDIVVKKQQLYSNISSLTFGIYLLHPFVIMIFMKLGMNTMLPHSCIMVPVYSVLVFAVSGAITFIIKKIPVIKLLL